MLPCPSVDIQPLLGHVAVFHAGGAGDDSNLAYEVAITDVALKCEYAEFKNYAANTDGSLSQNMEVWMRVYFTAQRGPAGAAQDVDVPYFIAVTDLRDSILSREEFPARIRLPRDGGSTVTREDNWLLFDLGDKTGAFFKIQTGFQLTPEQERYNRSRAGI